MELVAASRHFQRNVFVHQLRQPFGESETLKMINLLFILCITAGTIILVRGIQMDLIPDYRSFMYNGSR